MSGRGICNHHSLNGLARTKLILAQYRQVTHCTVDGLSRTFALAGNARLP